MRLEWKQVAEVDDRVLTTFIAVEFEGHGDCEAMAATRYVDNARKILTEPVVEEMKPTIGVLTQKEGASEPPYEKGSEGGAEPDPSLESTA